MNSIENKSLYFMEGRTVEITVNIADQHATIECNGNRLKVSVTRPNIEDFDPSTPLSADQLYKTAESICDMLRQKGFFDKSLIPNLKINSQGLAQSENIFTPHDDQDTKRNTRGKYNELVAILKKTNSYPAYKNEEKQIIIPHQKNLKKPVQEMHNLLTTPAAAYVTGVGEEFNKYLLRYPFINSVMQQPIEQKKGREIQVYKKPQPMKNLLDYQWLLKSYHNKKTYDYTEDSLLEDGTPKIIEIESNESKDEQKIILNDNLKKTSSKLIIDFSKPIQFAPETFGFKSAQTHEPGIQKVVDAAKKLPNKREVKQGARTILNKTNLNVRNSNKQQTDIPFNRQPDQFMKFKGRSHSKAQVIPPVKNSTPLQLQPTPNAKPTINPLPHQHLVKSNVKIPQTPALSSKNKNIKSLVPGARGAALPFFMAGVEKLYENIKDSL